VVGAISGVELLQAHFNGLKLITREGTLFIQPKISYTHYVNNGEWIKLSLITLYVLVVRVFNILYIYLLQTGPLFQHDIASGKTR